MQWITLIQHLAKHYPDVSLIAVSKYHDTQAMRRVLSCGVLFFGEARVNDASWKFEELADPTFEKHLIGHLQSRNVRQAVEIFDVIQTVDSLKLATKIDRIAGETWKTQRILIQVNLTGEKGKYGFRVPSSKYQIPNGDKEFGTWHSKFGITQVIDEIRQLQNLQLEWLMCMGQKGDAEITRKAFRELRTLVDQYELIHCSMGMSEDWQIAIEEGSTMVRIGRAIFDDQWNN